MTTSCVLVAKHIPWANRAQVASREASISSHLLPNVLSIVQCRHAIGVVRRNRSALPLVRILARIRTGADVWAGAGDSLSHGYGIHARPHSEADTVLGIRWRQPGRPP